MTSNDILARLREHEAELRASGITRLSLFGSTARGDGGEDSDIDLLATFAIPTLSLLDVIRVEHQLEELLGREVDLLVEVTPTFRRGRISRL